MRKKPSEEEIDRMVVAHVDDDSAWEEPMQVCKTKEASLSIPANRRVKRPNDPA